MKRALRVDDVLNTSDTLIRVCANLPNRQMAVAALAVALGRLCAKPGVDLEGALGLARVAGAPDDVSDFPMLITALSQLREAA